MTGKASEKQKLTRWLVEPLKPSYMVDLTKSKNLQWATKLGFQTLVAQDWNAPASLEEVEELLNNFVETDTLVLSRKN